MAYLLPTTRALQSALTLLALLSLNACTNLPAQKQDWQTAGIQAAKDPYTWVPLGGALLLAASDQDKKISQDAMENTPVFGSNKSASKASDDLRDLTSFLKNASALMVKEDCDNYSNPVERVIVQQVVVSGTHYIVDVTKELTERERPAAWDSYSFPSGHATKAYSYHAMTRENLRCSRYNNMSSQSVRWVSEISAAGTAWGRVEAGAHYPVDVLAGAALANFVAGTFNGAMRETHNQALSGIEFQLFAADDAITLGIRKPL